MAQDFANFRTKINEYFHETAPESSQVFKLQFSLLLLGYSLHSLQTQSCGTIIYGYVIFNFDPG